jgi:hypothetical protein
MLPLILLRTNASTLHGLPFYAPVETSQGSELPREGWWLVTDHGPPRPARLASLEPWSPRSHCADAAGPQGLRATFEAEPDPVQLGVPPSDAIYLAAVHGQRPPERTTSSPTLGIYDAEELAKNVFGHMTSQHNLDSTTPVWLGDRWEVLVWSKFRVRIDSQDPFSIYRMHLTSQGVQVVERFEADPSSLKGTTAYGYVDGDEILDRLLHGPCSTSLQVGEVTLTTPDTCCAKP